jgi:hypothetical protein
MRFFTKTLPAITLILMLGACAQLEGLQASMHPAPAPAKEIKSMLWLGNSFFYYNNSMHGHVGKLLSAAGQKEVRNTSATISGSGINWHNLESHFKPNGVGSYSFIAGNEVRFNTFERPFDAVMMMDCSQCPIHPKLKPIFEEYSKLDSDIARKHGAHPIFFMSWAYADKPEMTAQLASAYEKAGKDNNALVVPAGLAFANAISKRPEIQLIISDKRHPTLLGTYLAACTVMASVYKINPIGNSYTAGIDIETVKFLQTVAWETVQTFDARQGRGSL